LEEGFVVNAPKAASTAGKRTGTKKIIVENIPEPEETKRKPGRPRKTPAVSAENAERPEIRTDETVSRAAVDKTTAPSKNLPDKKTGPKTKVKKGRPAEEKMEEDESKKETNVLPGESDAGGIGFSGAAQAFADEKEEEDGNVSGDGSSHESEIHGVTGSALGKDFSERQKFGKKAAEARRNLGLTQGELASLMSTSSTSVSTWETRGMSMLSNKMSPFKKFVQFMAIANQAAAGNFCVSFEMFKAYAATTARNGLGACYARFSEFFEPEFLSALRNTNMEAMMMGFLANAVLEKNGVMPPLEDVLAYARNTFMPGYSTEDVLSMVDKIAETAGKRTAR